MTPAQEKIQEAITAAQAEGSNKNYVKAIDLLNQAIAAIGQG